MRERISLIIDLTIFIVGMPIVGFAYFVVDPLIAYYDGVKRRRKERMMRKSVMIILMLAMIGCSSVAHVRAENWIEEPSSNSKELQVFCQVKANSLHRLFYDVMGTNRYLMGMIHEDTKDFVPILFAQCKMENLGIMLFSTLTELVHTMKAEEVSGTTLNLLDQYLDFLKYDLAKAKLFEGMIGDPNSWVKSKEQLALKAASAHLEVAHGLLTHMKERLEELK